MCFEMDMLTGGYAGGFFYCSVNISVGSSTRFHLSKNRDVTGARACFWNLCWISAAMEKSTIFGRISKSATILIDFLVIQEWPKGFWRIVWLKVNIFF